MSRLINCFHQQCMRIAISLLTLPAVSIRALSPHLAQWCDRQKPRFPCWIWALLVKSLIIFFFIYFPGYLGSLHFWYWLVASFTDSDHWFFTVSWLIIYLLICLIWIAMCTYMFYIYYKSLFPPFYDLVVLKNLFTQLYNS